MKTTKKKKLKVKAEAKEFLSEWFIAGLEEIGMTADGFRALPTMEEKNEVREYLAEFGHY